MATTIVNPGTTHQWVMFKVDNRGDVSARLWNYHADKMLRTALEMGYILPNWENDIFSSRKESFVEGYCQINWHCHLHKEGDETGDYVLHYPSLLVTRKDCPKDYHCLNMEPEMFQVNLSYSFINDSLDYWISRYSEDGYRGRLNDTVHQDGVDWTDWQLFVGTREECQYHILELLDLEK